MRCLTIYLLSLNLVYTTLTAFTPPLTLSNIAFFITSTAVDESIFVRSRIIPASKTWMKHSPHIYVIVEDTHAFRFSVRHCTKHERSNHTVFKCPDEPTYLLSRVCNANYYGPAGPCCKVDESINYLLSRPELRHIKYFAHSDDDTYWRPHQLLRALSHHELTAENPLIPWVANYLNYNLVDAERGVWHISKCHEIEIGGWYQPLVMNKRALEQLHKSSSSYGLSQTCWSFVVTHDVAVGIWAWQHGLNHLHLPYLGGDLNKYSLAAHGFGHRASICNDMENWPAGAVYDQETVIGCGSQKFRIKDIGSHNKDMYDAYNWFASHGKDVQYPDPFTVNPLKGYNETNHYIQLKMQLASGGKWTAFSPADCQPPGCVQSGERWKGDDYFSGDAHPPTFCLR